MNFQSYIHAVQDAKSIVYKGKVEKIIGLVIESTGPQVNIGDVCRIYFPRDEKSILAEVVGFKEEKVLLMPFEDTSGIGPGCVVVSTGGVLQVPVGDALTGRTIDGFGRPIDDLPPCRITLYRIHLPTPFPGPGFINKSISVSKPLMV